MRLKALGRFFWSGEDRSSVAETPPRTRWDWRGFILTGLRRLRVGALVAARRLHSIRLDRLSWGSGVVYLLIMPDDHYGRFRRSRSLSRLL